MSTYGYFPGHYYRVLRGPYEGVIGQWAGVFTHGVIGLIWPGMPQEPTLFGMGGGARPVQFRLDDLEDMTPVSEVPEAFKDALP